MTINLDRIKQEINHGNQTRRKPPKELVKVPQCVADFIKTLKIRSIKPLMDSVTFGEIDFTEEKRD